MNIGDTVHLVSGSPRMTVIGVTASGIITTAWVAYNTGVPHTMSGLASCFTPETVAPRGAGPSFRRYQDEVPF